MNKTCSAVLVLCLACGETGSDPRDASRSDAGSDAASAPDSSSDAGTPDDAAAPDAAAWSGEELPPLRWTVPDCAAQHGVLARGIRPPGGYPFFLDHVAIGGGRLIVELDSEVLEVSSGRAEPLALDLPAEVTEWRLTPAPVAVGTDQLRAGAAYVADGETFLSQLLVVDRDRVELIPWSSTEATFFPSPAHFSVLDADGNWRFLGGVVGGPAGLHDVVVDRDLNITRSIWLTSEELPAVDIPQVELARSGARSMLVRTIPHPFQDGQAIELIPYDESAALDPVLVDDPLLVDGTAIDFVEAAADGDVVTILYRYAPREGGYFERIIEVSLTTGATLRSPESFGSDRPAHLLELLSAPGEGLDVVQQPRWPEEADDERYADAAPMQIYQGLARPVRLEDHTPLLAGAGAFVTHFDVQRDGDRLVIVWSEVGPQTAEPDPLDRTTAQGVYWAVLRCDR